MDEARLAPDAELISRVRVIESQPLAERAASYAALHEELSRRLQTDPAPGGQLPT